MKTIEVITFEGCGSGAALINELQAKRKDEPFDLQVSEVPSVDMASEMGLYGSPTIRIDGEEYQRERRGKPGVY